MKTVIVLIYILFSFASFAELTKEDEAKSGKSTSIDKKMYSPEEFRKAVWERVAKQLRKLGRTQIVEYSQELINKEEKLKVVELELKKDQEQLKLNYSDFENKLISFKDQQTKLINCISGQEKDKNKRINHMVDVISGMKPQVAAQVLSVQDTEIAVRMLGLLDATKVAKIFNLMDKEISARLQKQYMTMKR